MDIVNLLWVATLIVLTAFFVATEFAIVKVRSSRIDQLIEEGSSKAVSLKKIDDQLDAYINVCQVGITVTALGLGWLGKSAIETAFYSFFENIGLTNLIGFLSFLVAFMIIMFLRFVFGELVPKAIATNKAEAMALNLAKPLIIVRTVLYPITYILNGTAKLIVRLLGLKPADNNENAHSEEELRYILSESYKNGEINKSEMMYVNNIFEFDERVAREIMVPRTEMVCFYKEDSYETYINIIREGQFTRYPVADEDKDHIIGLVNIKELFTGHISEKESIEPHIRPILHVSESTPIKQVLLRMQKERIHMAIVVDEYGGTAGLITVEDILEEIVGDIRDEFDVHETPMIEELENGSILVDGKLLLYELNEFLGINLDEEEVDTIAGWIINQNVEAKKGTTVEYNNYKFTVQEIDGYQIKKIRIEKV